MNGYFKKAYLVQTEENDDCAVFKKNKAVAIGIFLFLIVLLVTFDIFDPDTFWHVANGRAMIETHQIVNKEIFSYTSAGKEFHNHEWLAQILLYLSYRIGGDLGLIVLKIFLTLSICLVLLFSSRQIGAGTLISAFLLLFFVFASLERFNVRPQLFSMLNLSILGFVLYGYRAKAVSKKMLFLLPVLMVFWDFLHGAIYGFVFLVAFIFAETIKRFFCKSQSLLEVALPMEQDRFRSLFIWTVITLLAMLINPYGLLSYDIFLQFIGKNQMVLVTNEFKRTPWNGFQVFWSFFALTTISLFWNKKRIDLNHIFIFLPFAYLAIRYERASEAFCPVMLPILSANVTYFYKDKLSKLLFPFYSTILVTLLVFITTFYVGYFKFFAPKHQFSFGYHIYEGIFPVGSVNFIKDVKLSGQLYNSGHFGGYLAYFLYPKHKIYHYMHHITFDISNLYLNDPALWKKWEAKKWNINFALASDEREVTIFRQNGFVPVFRDLASTVLVAQTPQNKEIVSQYGIKYFSPFLSEKRIREIAKSQKEFPSLMREMSVFLTYISNKEVSKLFGELITIQNSELSNGERWILLTNAEKSNPNNRWLNSAKEAIRK